jgi:mannose-6-phosphate isomerase-like protein (cupin superfamily)
VGEELPTLGRGESMFVARNIYHRIENISSVEPLEIIEIQTGDYLGEDDIVRVEDDFGRVE